MDERADGEWLSTRARLGLAAVALLAAAAFWGEERPGGRAMQAALVRVGVVAAAAWLAWPSLAEVRWLPRTRLGRAGVFAVAALAVVRPWVFGPVALMLLALTVFKRKK